MLAKNHFDDCPYNCNSNGQIVDTNLGKLIPCPHCSERKKELMKKGYVETITDEQLPLSTVLGINNEFLSTKYVYEGIIPEGEKVFIEQESLDWQSEISENLYLGLTIGDLPTESYCFGLSIKGRIDRFAYPMLAKAYLSGLTVGKFITCSEFNRLAFNVENSMDDYYNADFLMMLINDGSNLADISSAKGLMQTRALKGKPTVFVTTWTIEACSGLLDFKDSSSLYLAKPVFVKYKKSKADAKQSSYINNLLGVENKQLGIENKGRGVSLDQL